MGHWSIEREKIDRKKKRRRDDRLYKSTKNNTLYYTWFGFCSEEKDLLFDLVEPMWNETRCE